MGEKQSQHKEGITVRLERNFNKNKGTLARVAGGTTPCYPKYTMKPGLLLIAAAPDFIYIQVYISGVIQ